MARTRKLPSKTKTKNSAPSKNKRLGRVRRSVSNASGKMIKPVAPLTKPFKTKPFRFIGNFLYKILFIGYFMASWRELRQVTWPGRRETAQLTLAVFMFAIGFGIMIAVVDYGLDKLFKEVLL